MAYLRYLILLVSAALVLGGCATTSRISAPTEISSDERIVFGGAEVWVDGKKQKWGLTWSGEAHFYLLILPENSDKAVTSELSDDGNFYWQLAPGNYTLLGYTWTVGSQRRWNRLGFDFNVPESGPDQYVGFLKFQGSEYQMRTTVLDNYDEAMAQYDTKYPTRAGTSIKQLFKYPEIPGTFSSISGPCHESWKVECTKRFTGVTPHSPEVTTSNFPSVDSLTPVFKWKGSTRTDVSYDLILFEAAAFSTTGMVDHHMKGRMAKYVEDIKGTSWKPSEPLKKNTKYYWSVRLRDGDKVSYWSTKSHFTFMLVAWSSGYGEWFSFQTP
jgi:hypothetical protein